MTISKAWSLNLKTGNLSPLNFENNESIDEIVSSFPDGVYTTLRTYNHNHIFHLEDHFLRLEESMEISNFEGDVNTNIIQSALSKIIENSKFNELRIRLHIPFSDTTTCIILVEELIPYSDSFYQSGVKVKTNTILRVNPRAKLTSFIQKASNEKKFIKNTGLEESIITNDNQELLEGLSSNFFAVKNKTIWTARTGILNGITRKLVLEEAEKDGIAIIYKPVKLQELKELDEAFITSTSRGVMPVVKIDDIIIGNGKPGDLTIRLANLFKKRINSEIEMVSTKEN